MSYVTYKVDGTGPSRYWPFYDETNEMAKSDGTSYNVISLEKTPSEKFFFVFRTAEELSEFVEFAQLCRKESGYECGELEGAARSWPKIRQLLLAQRSDISELSQLPQELIEKIIGSILDQDN